MVFHGAPKCHSAHVIVFFIAITVNQIESDPKQPQAAHQHQAWYLKQPNHSKSHQGPNANRADSAPKDGFFL
jgi:hypothetical protein